MHRYDIMFTIRSYNVGTVLEWLEENVGPGYTEETVLRGLHRGKPENKEVTWRFELDLNRRRTMGYLFFNEKLDMVAFKMWWI